MRFIAYSKYDKNINEEARLNMIFSPVEIEKKIISTKVIKPNELNAIMLNLMKVSLFCTDDGYFTCNLG